MAFAPAIPYPATLPPQFAAAAALATRVEGLLTRFCDTHPGDDPELLIRVGRAVWNMTAVHKTIYLLANRGADRRHRRGKPDPTMTFLEHRVSELHDWVAEYQRLVRAMKQNPSQFVVTPSGGSSSESSSSSETYNIQHIETVPSRAKNVSPESKSVPPPPQPVTHNPQLLHAMDSSPNDNNAAANLAAPSLQENQNSSSNSSSISSAPLRLCVENSSAPAVSPSASSASLRFNSSPLLPSPLPTHLNSTPPLRNPLGTALATARETVAIAIESNIPFDPTNFFPADIDPAACIAAIAINPRKSNQSENPCPPPSSPEKITFRNRQVTLTGKPLPPNDLPQLPKLAAPSNPRQSSQSQNPCPLPNPLPNPKSAVHCPLSPATSPVTSSPPVPSRSDFFALINKITKQRPPSSAPPPLSPFDTPGTLSESILKNLKPGLRLPNPQPSPGLRRPPA